MEFFTEVAIKPSENKINYNMPLLFLGSCFAQNISTFFVNAKFNCNINPSGIVYNPLVISNLVKKIVENKVYCNNDFFFDGVNYCCYDFHGSFSHQNLEIAVKNANQSIKNAADFIKNASFCFVTLGTAYVYFLKQNSQPVSNCHKQNSDIFFRRRLEIEEVYNSISSMIETFIKVNPKIRFVLTVSPIRHWKDGAHGNRVSKAILLSSVEKIIENYTCAEYFPSYEIVEDQLRDYRFYAEDMIHLSPTAEKIIWEKLSQTYFSQKTQLEIKKVEKFMLSVKHRIIDYKSLKTKEFAKKNIEIANNLEKEIIGLDLSEEKKYFLQLLEN